MGLRDNLLLVEGKDDLRIIPQLVASAGVDWGPPKNEHVRIHDLDGYENLALQFDSHMKNAGLKRVGIVVDANTVPLARWRSVATTLAKECQLSDAPEPSGFVVESSKSGRRLGVWMMPDNGASGMMETFLLALRPANNAPLLKHVEDFVDQARTKYGAAFNESHRDKAIVHSWLGIQDPPGRQLHDAVKFRMLDSSLAHSAPFVAWFRRVFEL